MKARYEIKEDAKSLIKTHNLWLSIGLVQTILAVTTVSIYVAHNPFFHNDSSGFAYTIPVERIIPTMCPIILAARG